MAMLTVRNLPDEVHRALRVRAARAAHSTEAEVRAILASAVKPDTRVRMGDALADLGRLMGLTNEDVEVFGDRVLPFDTAAARHTLSHRLDPPRNRVDQVTDVLEFVDILVRELDAETFFDRHDQAHVAEAVPARDVGGGEVGPHDDVPAAKHRLENALDLLGNVRGGHARPSLATWRHSCSHTSAEMSTVDKRSM